MTDPGNPRARKGPLCEAYETTVARLSAAREARLNEWRELALNYCRSYERVLRRERKRIALAAVLAFALGVILAKLSDGTLVLI